MKHSAETIADKLLATRPGSYGVYAMRRLLNRPVLEIDGVKLHASLDAWSPRMARQILGGVYERRERILLRAALEPGDRVLEIGGGIGLIGLLSAQIVGAENVTVVEANPHLVPFIRENFELNGAEIRLINGAIVPNDHVGDTVTFRLTPDFWASSLLDHDAAAAPIDAPALRLSDALAQHRPNTLIMDVEGAEHAILMDAELACIDKLCIEFHTCFLGQAKIADIIAYLIAQGLDPDLQASGREAFLFTRRQSA